MNFIKSQDQETIIAQCTPSGSGAIALLRICGDDAITVANTIAALPGKKQLTDLPTHTIHFGHVVNASLNTIDAVMFLIMHAPRTFTGQNTVEITCHNNPFIIQEIIDAAVKAGARIAQEGEFTKRAVLNGKIDLLQAESINELIHANTKMALKKNLSHLQGSLSHIVTALEQQLLKALAFCEASFEFIDEEMTFAEQIKTIIDDVLATIAHIKQNFDQQRHIKEGVRVAIIGSVNAGKSSLFNALLGKNRAIVTSIAGTTRDVIEAGIYKDATYLTLVDTAGLRETDDIIETEGIARSFEQAELADIILIVIDGARIMSTQEYAVYQQLLDSHANKIILIRNKSDMASVDNPITDQAIEVSTKTGNNILQIHNTIEEKIQELFAKSDAPFLLNARQFNAIQSIEQKVQSIRAMLEKTPEYELLSYHLNDALAQVTELTGKSISEAAMDAIFREFCVGK